MAVVDTTPLIPKELHHIKWQDVVDVNYDPDKDPATVRSTSQAIEKFPQKDIPKIIAALEEIEHTENGQELFAALLAKQKSAKYENGAYQGQKVRLAVSLQRNYANFDETANGLIVSILIENQEKGAYINPDGQKIRVPLSTTLFHELVHASDDNYYKARIATERLDTYKAKVGYPDDLNGEFFHSLTSGQRIALLQNLIVQSNPNLSDEEKEKTSKTTEKILSSSSIVKAINHMKEEESRLYLTKTREDFATDRTNVYEIERATKALETPAIRSCYNVYSNSADYLNHPYGKPLPIPLTAEEQQSNDFCRANYKTITSSEVSSKDYHIAPVPTEQELRLKPLIDIPLSPLLLMSQPTMVSSDVGLNHSPGLPIQNTSTHRTR